MEVEKIKKKFIKQKRPWGIPTPIGYQQMSLNMTSDPSMDTVQYKNYTQADMIREYYPQSHAINDPLRYPDIYVRQKVEGKNGKMVTRTFKQPVPRCAYAFQQIIATKRTLHLIGNDIQFEHTDASTDEHTQLYDIFREGWATHSMDEEFGSAVLSTMIVAEAAIVFWMEGGKAKTRVLSYFNGDKLYPHYKRDGKTLSMFARSFNEYDEDGDEMAEYLEVYTEEKYYIFRKKSDKYKSRFEKIVEPLLQFFDIENYELIEEPVVHGLGRVPVAYFRRESGASWVFSQTTIDNYEKAKSQMAQNNQEYGEPALVVCSDEEASMFSVRDAKGSVKEIHVGKDDDVHMLQGQSAAEGYQKQTQDDEKLIYKQSFIVDTPEMKSGDLPAAALKIIYSLAYEKAYEESLEYKPFLDDCVTLFTIAFGIESMHSLDFETNLIPHMRWWIEPYIHQNESAVVADLVALVNSGIASKKTACSRLESIYTVPAEYKQLQYEEHREDAAELLQQVKLMKAQAKSKEDIQD